jgi:hypothetical protein
MSTIGSTRMAMRWSFSDLRRTLAAAGALALIGAAGFAANGCTRTSTFYVPSAGETRLNQDDFRDESDQILSVECPRLMGTSDFATGEARARIQVDKSGAVQRVQFTRPSNDERMNTVWGALAARLQFDPQEGQTEDLRTSMITIGYSCGKGTALTTLQF